MYELKRVIYIFKLYLPKFAFIWVIALVFGLAYYFISSPEYESHSRILLKESRRPWAGFKAGQLPGRKRSQGEKAYSITLRDPFWNFLYDQLEKTTYDFTPFFYSRTTVLKVMDDVGCREHFDNGKMDPDEIVIAFTENLQVEFDRVTGMYDISYKFIDPHISNDIVNKFAVLFMDFINELTREKNIPNTKVIAEKMADLEREIEDIENQQAELKANTGIIAPVHFFSTLTSHLYTIEMRLVQARSRAQAASNLLSESDERIDELARFGSGISDTRISPVKEILVDPLLTIILSRIFWDSINLIEAQMTYVDESAHIKYWSDRLERSKQLYARRVAENEKARYLEIVMIFTEETAKAIWLSEHKKETEDRLNMLPEVEKDFIYLQRKRLAKSSMLASFRDLHHTGESYIEKGEKIGTILDLAYLPKKKSDPKLWIIILSSLFTSTVCGFGWFFIRENIEVHAAISNTDD